MSIVAFLNADCWAAGAARLLPPPLPETESCEASAPLPSQSEQKWRMAEHLLHCLWIQTLYLAWQRRSQTAHDEAITRRTALLLQILLLSGLALSFLPTFFSISINLFYFSIEQGLLQKKFQLKSIWCFSLDLLLFFFLLFIFSQSLSVSLSFRAKINCHRKMSLLNIFNHFE